MSAIIQENQVRDVLRSVHDPELRMSILELGLIYSIDISEENNVHIRMTVTTPGCPIIGQFLDQVKERIRSLEGVGKVTVELTFDPPWSVDRIQPEARLKLGL